MSLSGLCRRNGGAHEVGPVLVFVSKENPTALALSLYNRREVEGGASWFICLHSLASLRRVSLTPSTPRPDLGKSGRM